MGFIIYIIAYILEIPLNILTFIAVLIKHSKRKGFLKVVNSYFYQASIAKDRFGNYNYRTLFNMCLIKKTSKHLFGNVLETISSVLGKNQLDKTLTITGWVLVILLWAMVHPKHWGIGHCAYYIEEVE
jgi:hypothetical protein